MFGFACRNVYAHGPWPWKTDGGGPAGEARTRLPRGLLGGQTVVLLTVWAVALIGGVALAGPPGGAPRDGGTAAPAAADPTPHPVAVPAVPEAVPPVVRSSGPEDAGSDIADLEGDGVPGGDGLEGSDTARLDR